MGNGGWDQVDWQQGSINGYPIEVHWLSVLAFIEELSAPAGNRATPTINSRPLELAEAKAMLMGRKVAWAKKSPRPPIPAESDDLQALKAVAGISRQTVRNLRADVWPEAERSKRGPRQPAANSISPKPRKT
jgi:hypothetical protein